MAAEWREQDGPDGQRIAPIRTDEWTAANAGGIVGQGRAVKVGLRRLVGPARVR
jgi:hypothetical protein